MSASDKAETRGGGEPGSSAGVSDHGQGKSKGTSSNSPKRPADVGRALRSVYDDTLREDIPADLKDLLGRLG